LAQTEWYVRQLRDNPIRPFDPERAPEVWRGVPATFPTWPVHTMTDADITSAAVPRMTDRPITIPLGPLSHTLPAREALYLGDVAVLRALQQNLGRRPVAWSVTAGSRFYGLDRYLLQQGLSRRLLTAPPDTAEPWITPASLTGVPLDVPLTERLVWETFRYAGLLDHDLRNQDDTNVSFAATLSLPFTQLAYAYEALGDYDQTIRSLERAFALAPNPAISAALNQMRLDRLQDSTVRDSP
jgi:tetratricopeptide (TPR) repeat protein